MNSGGADKGDDSGGAPFMGWKFVCGGGGAASEGAWAGAGKLVGRPYGPSEGSCGSSRLCIGG